MYMYMYKVKLHKTCCFDDNNTARVRDCERKRQPM